MSNQYVLVFRRYVPFVSFGGGFEGDHRNVASTSRSGTYRTGAFITFTSTGISGYFANSSGTVWTNPVTGSRASGMSMVTVKLTDVRRSDGALSFFCSTAGSNPLTPGSPPIDTHVRVSFLWKGRSLSVVGEVLGDAFPNAEVFIEDAVNKAVLLVDFKTKGGTLSGPATYLFGAGLKTRLAQINKVIQLTQGNTFA